jgi:hypothetical protein
MALLHDFNFTGPLGDLTFYHMKGCSRPVVRTKGGVSKARIKNDPRYDMTRRNGSEFGGRGHVAGHIMREMRHIRAWETHLLVGEINNWLDPLQKMDTVSAKGRRGILFSKGAQLLHGMPLSSGVGFDAVVTAPLTATVSREALTAQVNIPAFRPGATLYLPHKQPVYRFAACLLVLPDFIYHEDAKGFRPVPGYNDTLQHHAHTEWLPATEPSASTTLELSIPNTMPDERFGLMLCVGLHLGALRSGLRLEAVRNAGTAKVLSMA